MTNPQSAPGILIESSGAQTWFGTYGIQTDGVHWTCIDSTNAALNAANNTAKNAPKNATKNVSRNADALVHEIWKALHSVGCPFSQIQRITLGVGPGSFTGIRVGMTAAKSIAHALMLQGHAVELFEFSSLQALALSHLSDLPNLSIQSDSRNPSTAASRVYVTRKACTGESYLLDCTLEQLKTQSLVRKEVRIFDKDWRPSQGLWLDENPDRFGATAFGTETPAVAEYGIQGLTIASSLAKPWSTDIMGSFFEWEPHYVRASDAEEKLLKSKSIP